VRFLLIALSFLLIIKEKPRAICSSLFFKKET